MSPGRTSGGWITLGVAVRDGIPEYLPCGLKRSFGKIRRAAGLDCLDHRYQLGRFYLARWGERPAGGACSLPCGGEWCPHGEDSFPPASAPAITRRWHEKSWRQMPSARLSRPSAAPSGLHQPPGVSGPQRGAPPDVHKRPMSGYLLVSSFASESPSKRYFQRHSFSTGRRHPLVKHAAPIGHLVMRRIEAWLLRDFRVG